jgi:hypothetical protein
MRVVMVSPTLAAVRHASAMGLRPRRTTLAVVLLAATATASGCGGSPSESPPSGVDGLTIPTPAPDPRDFTDQVTNPWLALKPGARWEYHSTDGAKRLVTVTGEQVEVEGVEATVVHTEEYAAGTELTAVRDDLYAQDRAGNVWLLGRRVRTGQGQSWLAGTDGARAGLAMAAVPRRGDGYAVADARGADEDRALVVSTNASTATPVATYEHGVLVEYSSVLQPGEEIRRTYARGAGLVSEDDVVGGTGSWLLTSLRPG